MQYVKQSGEEALKQIAQEHLLEDRQTKTKFQKNNLNFAKKDETTEQCMAITSETSEVEWMKKRPGAGIPTAGSRKKLKDVYR